MLAMLIDDRIEILEFLKHFLEDEGWEVSLHQSLPEPAIVRELKPRVVIMDILFDGKPLGLAFLEALRAASADPYTKHLPVILCSVDAPTLSNLEMLNSQVTAPDNRLFFLHKPFDLDPLLQILENLQN